MKGVDLNTVLTHCGLVPYLIRFSKGSSENMDRVRIFHLQLFQHRIQDHLKTANVSESFGCLHRRFCNRNVRGPLARPLARSLALHLLASLASFARLLRSLAHSLPSSTVVIFNVPESSRFWTIVQHWPETWAERRLTSPFWVAMTITTGKRRNSLPRPPTNRFLALCVWISLRCYLFFHENIVLKKNFNAFRWNAFFLRHPQLRLSVECRSSRLNPIVTGKRRIYK